MSDADAPSEIEIEYEEAKKTAYAYLRAVGVLDPDKISTPGYREREIRALGRVILQGRTGEGDFPNDPFAVDAALLGQRYLHQGYDSGRLEAILAWGPHPAYREAITIIVGELQKRNFDPPEPLRIWKQEHKRTKVRWRSERARNYRIGLVVEAMAVGSNVLIHCRENERRLRRLQVDLWVVCEQLGETSFKKLFTGHAYERLQNTGLLHEIRNVFVHESLNNIERILEILNQMNARPWRHCNRGKGLTERDLAELTKLPLSEGMGGHTIRCDNGDNEVRKHFPNLYETRDDATADNGFPFSICDAVAAVLTGAKQRGSSYRNVLRALKAYRDTI